jgi:2-oxoglutarate ferredoxin oxidoreductase subunit beta
VLQNCVIFNDGTHAEYTDKEVRADRTIILRHGEPMIYGKDRNKGLVLDMENMCLKSVTIGENGITESDILVHNAQNPDPGIHMMIINMKSPEMPVALGVIRAVKDLTYDDNVRDQVLEVQKNRKICSVDELLHSGSTWTVD